MPERKLIIGEGAGDESFFRAFLASRRIAGYDVHPRREQDGSGSGYFERALRALKVRTEVAIDTLSLLVIVADNDSDPVKSFKDVRAQIQGAEDFGVPRTPLKATAPLTKSATYPFPHIAVMMLPGPSACGALESLCYQSAKAKRPREAACVEQLTQCLGAAKWDATKRDKLLLGCLLGGICKQNPNVTLRRVWSVGNRCPRDMVPLDHQCFDWIEKQLLEWNKNL